MALKKFCDRCDKHIPDGDPTYRASFSQNVDRDDAWNSYARRLTIGRKLVDPQLNYDMLDKNCAVEILNAMLPSDTGA